MGIFFCLILINIFLLVLFLFGNPILDTIQSYIINFSDKKKTLQRVYLNSDTKTIVIVPDNCKCLASTDLDTRDNVYSVCFCGTDTKIQKASFAGCKNLKTIELPSKLKEIPDFSFAFCKKLDSITVPSTVSKIGARAFLHCKNIKKIRINGNIGIESFANCTKLSKVYIGENITSIKEGAFRECKRIKHINIPHSVTSIEKNAFRNCVSLSKISTPFFMRVISSNTFENCKNLKSVETHAVNVSIEKFAFRNCSSLTTIKVFDKNVKLVIDEEAFSGLGKGQVEIITVKNEHLSKEELQKVLNKDDLSRFPWLEIKEGK